MTHSGFRTLLAGIGIRVETNESGEFVIDHVHRNGAAERNGNVKHGDVIDTIDGQKSYLSRFLSICSVAMSCSFFFNATSS